ncbi:M48 family metalloprotease [Streptomyces sp. NPDC002073]
MNPTLRALRALALLAGFHLLGLLMLALLGAVDWAAVTWTSGPVYVKVVIVSVLLAVPIVRGMFMLRTPKDPDGAPGPSVTEAQEPRLWQTVRELAEQVGTRAPDEIVLVAGVNAAVTEDARLGGLLPGPRRMYLGLSLMAGLDENRLRSVIAHELGHFVHADTRLGALVGRGQARLLRTIGHFEEKADSTVAKERARQEKRADKRTARGKKAKAVDTTGSGITYRTMAKIYTGYAKLYVRATRSDARRQEFAADLAAARITGRDATAGALRATPALDAAHDFYMDAYATLGVDAGLLPRPGEVFGGLRHMIEARPDALAEASTSLPTETAGPYDTHPPIAERVARIEALPYDGRGAETAGPALGLLADAGARLAEIEKYVLTPQALGLRRVDWPDLVHESMRAYTARAGETLRTAVAAECGGEGTAAAMLDAIDAGALWRIAEQLPKSEEARAASGRAAREFVRPALHRGLRQLVVLELADRGAARWLLSWSDEAELRLPDGFDDRLGPALDAAVGDRPDTGPLRDLLARAAPRTPVPSPAPSPDSSAASSALTKES